MTGAVEQEHSESGSRRVGVIRVGSLGDHLIALPIYHQLREIHRRDALTLISNVPAAGNPKLVGPASILPPGLFDQTCAYPALSGWAGVWAAIRLFRRLQLDQLYYLMPRRTSRQLRRDRVFFGLSGTHVVGLNAIATDPVRPVARGLYEHEADRLARAIGLRGGRAERTEGRVSMQLTALERAEAARIAGAPQDGVLVVSVGTKCDVKDWGIDKWRALIQRLSELRSVDRLVLVGSEDEYHASDSLKAAWRRRADNFCGRLSPRMSAAVMASAKLFVGHDSGPMHMAAAVGVPIVAIFSSRSLPGQWFPLTERSRTHYTVIDCMGCGRERCDDLRKACIERISVDEVFASCVAMLPDEMCAAASGVVAIRV